MNAEKYLEHVISARLEAMLPRVIADAIRPLQQQFIPLAEASRRYDLAPSSLRNYHRSGLITLRKVLKGKRSKLFVSTAEIEQLLRDNPLPR